jgi:hypothetical protein
MDGWIKLHRKFASWEWFNISEMVHLFIYLLLNANSEDGEWRGIEVKRGQIITGLNSLNEKTKISIQTLRTCLTRLEKTGEINTQTTNQYRIITICNYELYQDKQQATNKRSNKQLTSDQQATNNKQEEEEHKKYIYSSFYDSEIEKSQNDENYIEVVKILFGKNSYNKPLNVLLKMPTQLSYEQFLKIWRLKKEYGIIISVIFEKIENWGNHKKNTTIYGTFLTFAKNENKSIKLS